MNKFRFPIYLTAGLVCIIAIGLIFRTASAHQTIVVGDYEVEIGWLDEPPVVGQRNAIVVNIASNLPSSADSNSGSSADTIDITGLMVNVSYGGETKPLSLQPLSEDSQGQYIAPIIPTRPGIYTIQLSGTLGSSPVQAEVEPEEVDTAGSLQFPAPGKTNPNLPLALGVGALLVSLAALATALIGPRRNRL